MFVTRLSYQEVEGKLVEFRGLPDQWPQFETVKPLVMFKLTSGQLHVCTKWVFLLRPLDILNQVSGDQGRYFQTEHDLILSKQYWSIH